MFHQKTTGMHSICSSGAICLLIKLILLLSVNTTSAQNETDVLREWLMHTDARNTFYNHLAGQAFDLLEKRSEEIEKLKTMDDWRRRQRFIRETLMDIAGPFPDRTPLNAKVVRTIDKGAYRIEHIIFESQPGFFVTSSLFLPAGMKRGSRAPAIIYCSGHTAEGYRSAAYQHIILNLVKKGFIVFAFDPVGQGERLEYYDPETGRSMVGGPTREHSYPGAQAFITGSSQAMYMIWDGIRAVDYLISRKEVDQVRIGITGRSGGGTQSAYIAAFDDRILAAAPENYITNYTRLLQSIGPQDAEQNLFNIIIQGLDHPDFLTVRAPKPALMITTTGDMFSIQGAVETEMEVSSIYKSFGREENFSRIEDDAGHASTLKNREGMYAFFQRHLHNPGNPYDEETQLLTPEELRVTADGQVSVSLKSETVFSINRRAAEILESNLNSFRNDPEKFLPEAVASAKRLSGYWEPDAIDEPVFTGRVRRDGYVIEKYFTRGEGNYVIPYLLFRPENSSGKAMIYLSSAGKSAGAGIGGEIEMFVSQGFVVIAPDLAGKGEMGPGALKGDAYFDGASHNLWYASMLTGRSITGILAGDVVRLTSVLKKLNSEVVITGFADQRMAPALIHAAAFSSDIGSIILSEPYTTFSSLVMNRFYDPHLILTAVPGALREYDLPDLETSLAARKIFIEVRR
ncbi:MAG: acetylxylan esterase [Bacteroidales bacterium]